MKEKTKDSRLTVRLTPNQTFMLAEISKQVDRSKSEIMRYIIDDFITKYLNAKNE